MRKLLRVSLILTCVLAVVPHAFGQATATPAGKTGAQVGTSITSNRVIGDVTAIDAAALSIALKVDGSAGPVTAALNDKTIYYRAKSDILSRAATATISPADLEKITLAEVGVGDRVVVLGKVADDKSSVPARILIVATKADLAQKQERDREEWRRRGIVGTVSALNPETKEITLQLRSIAGAQPITIAAGGEKVKFRRYAPDSVKFGDARPSSLADIKVGDQLRAKGDKSEDGSRFTAEEVVTGTFRSIRGTVESVNASAGDIKVKDMATGQSVTISISKDSMVRRIPAEFAQRLAMRGQRGGAGGGEGGNGGGAQGEASTNAQPRPQGEGVGGGGGGRRRPEGAGTGEGMGYRRRMGGSPDILEMLERMPPVTVAELKPGEMVIVSSTAGADASRATAIALVAGVDALLQAEATRPQRGGAQGTSLGLPSGALDNIGIGLP
jgi:transcription antitermination factor NusG